MKQARQAPQRLRSAPDVGAFSIFARVLRCIDQPDEQRWKIAIVIRTAPRHVPSLDVEGLRHATWATQRENHHYSVSSRAHGQRTLRDVNEKMSDRLAVAELLDAWLAPDYRYDKEKRAAVEKWVAILTEIVGIKPAPTAAPARPTARANIYEFRTRRAQANVR